MSLIRCVSSFRSTGSIPAAVLAASKLGGSWECDSQCVRIVREKRVTFVPSPSTPPPPIERRRANRTPTDRARGARAGLRRACRTLNASCQLGVFTLVTRGRAFDVSVKNLALNPMVGIFDVSPENDCASPNVKTPCCTLNVSCYGESCRTPWCPTCAASVPFVTGQTQNCNAARVRCLRRRVK